MGLLCAVDRGVVRCGVAHGGGARGGQAAAGPPAWLLRAAAAQGLPLQSLGAMRAPPGVDRLLARSGKRLREGVPPSDTPEKAAASWVQHSVSLAHLHMRIPHEKVQVYPASIWCEVYLKHLPSYGQASKDGQRPMQPSAIWQALRAPTAAAHHWPIAASALVVTQPYFWLTS